MVNNYLIKPFISTADQPNPLLKMQITVVIFNNTEKFNSIIHDLSPTPKIIFTQIFPQITVSVCELFALT